LTYFFLLAENNGPFSEDTLERSPEIDEDGKPNYGGRKRSSGMTYLRAQSLTFDSGLGE